MMGIIATLLEKWYGNAVIFKSELIMKEIIPQGEDSETKENLSLPKIEIRRENSIEFVAHTIQSYEDVGDEEAVFMLALILNHPEWKEEIFSQIKQYKPHIKNLKELFERIRSDYSGWKNTEDQDPSTNVAWWTKHMPEVRNRITNLISYFRPTDDTTASEVIIIPSDKLLSSKDTGRSFHVGHTTAIMSHTENLDNLEHEFLHGIINPLTEKLRLKIPEDKVVAMASNKLKHEEMYGDHALSLLNEELIRTYNDLIKTGKPIRTFTDFKNIVNSLDENRFAQLMNTEPSTKTRFSAMGIESLTDLKARIQEYYDRYEKNELRDKIYSLYEKFNEAKIANTQIRFEDFLTKEIENLFY
jgi:hypothetical protein